MLYYNSQRITFLGTGSGYPCPTRGASGLVLHLDQSKSQWLFDCGEGTQIQAQKADNVKIGSLEAIFISHLHGDHIFGLPGLLCTAATRTAGLPAATNGDNEEAIDMRTLHIIGPQGLRIFLRVCLSLSSSQLNIRYACHELHHSGKVMAGGAWSEMLPHSSTFYPNIPPLPFEVPGVDIFQNDSGFWEVSQIVPLNEKGLRVSAVWLGHSIPSFGWVVREPEFPGTLDMLRAKSLGVPKGPLLGELKMGRDVSLADGRQVLSKEVLGPPIPGRCICIMGDSCDSSALLEPALGLVTSCTRPILIHEVTLEDAMQEDALKKGHSTPGMVGSWAASLRVHTLLATHFSQRYDLDTADTILKTQLEQAANGAANSAKSSVNVLCARDLLVYNVPSAKELMLQ